MAEGMARFWPGGKAPPHRFATTAPATAMVGCRSAWHGFSCRGTACRTRRSWPPSRGGSGSETARGGRRWTRVGAAFGAIVGTLASELLRLAYEPAGGHQVLGAADPSTIDLLLVAHRPVVGARALALALDLLGARQAGPPADAVAAFLDWAKPIQLHDQDAHLADVAAVRGIPWRASRSGRGRCCWAKAPGCAAPSPT